MSLLQNWPLDNHDNIYLLRNFLMGEILTVSFNLRNSPELDRLSAANPFSDEGYQEK